jgi:hypothetical protein
MNKSEGTMSKMGKVAALGGLAIAGGLAVGLKKSVDAAIESEKAQTRLNQAMQGAGLSQDKYGKSIEANIQKTSRLAALDDEDLSDSFAKLVRSTGDVTKATEGMNLAADIARSRNVSLETATKAVEKAYNGSGKALARFGVVVDKTSEGVDAAKLKIDTWRDANGKLTDSEEIKAKALLTSAKKMDNVAFSMDAISSAQDKFADGAKKYGETAAGAQERFGVAVENLQEKIGAKLLPVLAKLMEMALKVIDWMETNWPKLEKIITPVLEDIKRTIQQITADIQRIWEAHGKQILAVVEFAFKYIKASIENALKIIQGVIDVVMGILTGDWQRAWDGIKEIVAGVFAQIKNILTTAITALGVIAKALGKAILDGVVDGLEGIGNAAWHVIDNIGSVIEDVAKTIHGWGKDIARFIINGIVDGLGGLGQKILDELRDAWNWAKDKAGGFLGKLNPIGDARDPNYVPSSGFGGGIDLMGASPVMMPFAAMGQALGLRVTSGLRPGAVTANGTPSDHGFGKALDMADGPSAMAAFFKALIGNPSVKQAFYDPLGSIFGGKWNSYREGGHSDHVHVATYDQGGLLRPGWTMAYNGTGRNEYVSNGGGVINFNFPQYIGSKQELMALMREAAATFQRQNGRPAFGS